MMRALASGVPAVPPRCSRHLPRTLTSTTQARRLRPGRVAELARGLEGQEVQGPGWVAPESRLSATTCRVLRSVGVFQEEPLPGAIELEPSGV